MGAAATTATTRRAGREQEASDPSPAPVHVRGEFYGRGSPAGTKTPRFLRVRQSA